MKTVTPSTFYSLLERDSLTVDYTKDPVQFYFDKYPDDIHQVMVGDSIFTKDIEPEVELNEGIKLKTPLTFSRALEYSDEEIENIYQQVLSESESRIQNGTASMEEMVNFIKERIRVMEERQLNENTENEDMKKSETNLDLLVKDNLSRLNEKALIDSLSTGHLHIVKFTDAATYDEGKSDIEILISAEIVNTEKSFSFNKWEEIKDKLIETWT